MKPQKNIYESARILLDGIRTAERNIARRELGAFMRQEPRRDLWCGLCRFVQKSPLSFLSPMDRECRSCAQRGHRPRWVNIDGNAIGKWRGLSTQREFAEMCNLSQTTIYRLENQRRMNSGTAVCIATGLAVASRNGRDLRIVAQDWPLFPLLVDNDVVCSIIADAEIADILGEEERPEHLHEERGTDSRWADREGRGDGSSSS